VDIVKGVVLLVVVMGAGCSGLDTVPGDLSEADIGPADVLGDMLEEVDTGVVPPDANHDMTEADVGVPYCPTYCDWEPHYRQCGPGDCQAGYKCPPDGLIGCVPSSCQCMLEGTECKMYCTTDCSEASKLCVPDPDCVRDCVGRDCGPDGCGGSCGTCVDCDGKPIACSGGKCSVYFCCKDCTNRECGPDGCGGLCGTCDKDPLKPVCGAQQQCVPVACTLPTAWGKIGAVASMETPGAADEDFIKDSCPDFSGDGIGDNGLKVLSTAINPEFKKALEGGAIGIIFEFRSVTDFANTTSFELAALSGAPDTADATKYLIDSKSYELETPSGECAPVVSFDAAQITSGVLSAGPGRFVLSIPIVAPGFILDFTLEDTRIKATITDDGVNATDGVIAGLFTKEQADALYAKLDGQCAVKPTDICSYLGTVKAFLPMLFDLDQNKDGKTDAASICMKFTLKGGTIAGMVQP
jgi:hypothetical protein